MSRRSSSSHPARSSSSPNASPKHSCKPYDSQNRRSESPRPLSAPSSCTAGSAGSSSYSDPDGSFIADFRFPPSEPLCDPGHQPRQPRVFDISPSDPIPASPPPADVPGCPTYVEYQALEADYLARMTPTKLSKALISTQTLVCVAHQIRKPYPLSHTPQFRFWVRKMFSMGHEQTQFDVPAVDLDGECLPVIMHDGRPVAVKEQLYEVLCYCHQLSGHAGRDRTSATVWARYSWIPKELIARFVRACPTCIVKRGPKPTDPASPECIQVNWSGPEVAGPETSSGALAFNPAVAEGSFNEEAHSRSAKDDPMDLCSQLVARYSGGPDDLSLLYRSGPSSQVEISAPSDSVFSPTFEFLNICLSPNPENQGPPDSPLSATSSGFPSPLFPGAFDPNPPHLSNPWSMGGLPMVRQVSLYDGLPNGWEDSSDVRLRHLMRMANMPEEPTLPALQLPEIPATLPKLRSMHSAGDVRSCHVRSRLPPISRVLSAGSTPKFVSPVDDAVKQGAFAAMMDPALLPRMPPPAITHAGYEDNSFPSGSRLSLLGPNRSSGPAPPSRLSFTDRLQAMEAARVDAKVGMRRAPPPVALRVTTDSLRVASAAFSSESSLSPLSAPPMSACTAFSTSTSLLSSGPPSAVYPSSAPAFTFSFPFSSLSSPLSPSSIPVLSPTTISSVSPNLASGWREPLTPVMGGAVGYGADDKTDERGVYGWQPDVTEEWLNMDLIEQEQKQAREESKEVEMGDGGVGGWGCGDVNAMVV